jgi:signal peptidase I
MVGIMLFQTVTMQESSMEPTIAVGDRFFINRVVYKFSSPKRGDLIVFRTNASDDAALHIRRVIGLPGETIQISGGRILIDGEAYKEGSGD